MDKDCLIVSKFQLNCKINKKPSLLQSCLEVLEAEVDEAVVDFNVVGFVIYDKFFWVDNVSKFE